MQNFTQYQAGLRRVGITLKRSFPGCSEYRVNFTRGAEATAYYTDDLDDAYVTGKLMAKECGTIS